MKSSVTVRFDDFTPPAETNDNKRLEDILDGEVLLPTFAQERWIESFAVNLRDFLNRNRTSEAIAEKTEEIISFLNQAKSTGNQGCLTAACLVLSDLDLIGEEFATDNPDYDSLVDKIAVHNFLGLEDEIIEGIVLHTGSAALQVVAIHESLNA